MATLILHQFAKDIGTESASPFCVKVHRALGLKGVDYSVRTLGSPNDMKRLNPERRKLPVLEVDGTLIADSTRILEFLDENYTKSPLWSDEHSVYAAMLEDWADESLYWYAVYLRWQVDSNFTPFSKRAFAKMPSLLRMIVPGIIRKKVLASLHGQGIGRLPLEEVLTQLKQHLHRLNLIVQEQEWMSGGIIGAADIALFGLVRQFSLETMPQSQGLVTAQPQLVAWLKKVDERTRSEHTIAVA